VVGRQAPLMLTGAGALDDDFVAVDTHRGRPGGSGALPRPPVVHQEQRRIGVATVEGAGEVFGLGELVRRVLHLLERLVVPAGRWALIFGEDDETLAPVDQLAERRPGTARPFLIGVGDRHEVPPDARWI